MAEFNIDSLHVHLPIFVPETFLSVVFYARLQSTGQPTVYRDYQWLMISEFMFSSERQAVVTSMAQNVGCVFLCSLPGCRAVCAQVASSQSQLTN